MRNEPAYCRKCGRPIMFLTTKRGKLMPVDGFSFNVVPREDGGQYWTEDGSMIRGMPVDMPGPKTVKAWMCHFVTCPEGDAFRKRTEKKTETWNEMQTRIIRERIEKAQAEADARERKREERERKEAEIRAAEEAQYSIFQL